MRIFRSLKRWDSQRPLKPWIMGITVNRCRTWMVQRAKRPELADYLHETVATRPADDSVELVREIQAAISARCRTQNRRIGVRGHFKEALAASHHEECEKKEAVDAGRGCRQKKHGAHGAKK